MRVDNSHPSGYLTFTARMPLFKQSTHLQIAGGNFYDVHGNNLSPTHEDHVRYLLSADDADVHGKQALEDTADRPPSPDAPDWLAEVPVIYPRNSDSAQSASKNGASFRTEDAYTLENDFVGGGQIISIHSPDAASAWLDAHFHDALLESMRFGGIGGPIAVMLSPDEPALAIFGNLLDEGGRYISPAALGGIEFYRDCPAHHGRSDSQIYQGNCGTGLAQKWPSSRKATR
ncbi:hypothetical protein B0H10DRAFT_55639 [Mycena sp. CBHHK59/15]|nr:hypothetical protein B0H10DRAFT_55639 [Mycena sp. CBHHK59/15]